MNNETTPADEENDSIDWKRTLIVQLGTKAKKFLRDHERTKKEKEVLHAMLVNKH